jgi:predicted  nucleic acid-binding Zn-ribbon protein
MTLINDELSDGEVRRTLARIEESIAEVRQENRDGRHKLANDMNAMITPLSSLGIRMNIAETNIEKITRNVDNLRLQSGFISGAIAAGGALLNWLMGKHS